MEISYIDNIRKRQFAFSCLLLALPVAFFFILIDFFENEPLEALVDIVLFLVLLAALIAVKKYNASVKIFRVSLILLSLLFLYNVSIGAGDSTVLYWLFSFPPIFMFFLEKKEGTIFSIFFLCSLSFLLFNPFSLDIYAYNTAASLRFLISFVFVILLSLNLEAARERYGHMLIEKQLKLTEEKRHLEQALGEIKTLSGLIPICSRCKKVRDDRGYWQQVEVYVRNHTTADFSHGICPDCAEVLYADIACLPSK